MLEIIENTISDLMADKTEFDVVYSRYVMKIQDENIDKEISYMLTNNIVSIELLDRAILKSYQELIEW